MIVSHRHKFIFVKTRKTAGTSMEIFLSKICGREDILTPIYPQENGHFPRNHEGFFNHMPALNVKSILGEDIWNSYFKFCVERNPWDKVVSQFFWCRSNLEFKSFVMSSELPSDIKMYLNHEGDIMMDAILKYEELQDGVKYISSRIGLEFSDPISRAKSGFRNNIDYREMYDDETVGFVAEKFKKEIELFSYKF